jgi:hypothetical protein
MKVDALKAYLRQYGLPLAGAKYALVARCAAHARGDLRGGPQRTPPSAGRRHTMVAQDAVESKYLAMKIPQLQVCGTVLVRHWTVLSLHVRRKADVPNVSLSVWAAHPSPESHIEPSDVDVDCRLN